MVFQSSNFLEPNELFKGEVEETILKVTQALEVLKYFKQKYEECRANIKNFFKGDAEVKEWEFAPQLVFSRFDLYVERVEIVKVS